MTNTIPIATASVPLAEGKLWLAIDHTGALRAEWPGGRPPRREYTEEEARAFREARAVLFEALAKHHGVQDLAPQDAVQVGPPLPVANPEILKQARNGRMRAKGSRSAVQLKSGAQATLLAA